MDEQKRVLVVGEVPHIAYKIEDEIKKFGYPTLRADNLLGMLHLTDGYKKEIGAIVIHRRPEDKNNFAEWHNRAIKEQNVPRVPRIYAVSDPINKDITVRYNKDEGVSDIVLLPPNPGADYWPEKLRRSLQVFVEDPFTKDIHEAMNLEEDRAHGNRDITDVLRLLGGEESDPEADSQG